jgi:hypothetical protein
MIVSHPSRFTNLSVAAILIAATAACSNVLGPEHGAAPKDPGTLIVTVRDERGTAVPNAGVSVALPDGAGGTFFESAYTGPNGRRVFYYVPAGRRRVEVTPPAGYPAGTPKVIEEVEVVKDQATTAAFVLRRGPG